VKDEEEPDTLPVTFPVKFPVTLPVRFPDTFPTRDAVTIPAAKFPDPSRFTIVEGVFTDVAALAANSAECIFAAELPPTEFTVAVEEPGPVADTSPFREVIAEPDPALTWACNFSKAIRIESVAKIVVLLPVVNPVNSLPVTTVDAIEVALWVPVTSPDREPVKLVAVMAVVALVAVVAFPVKFAVIVPAAKFPEAFLSTSVLGVFSGVASRYEAVAVAILAAEAPPTNATVAVAIPGPIAVTSPISWVIALDEPNGTSVPVESCMYTTSSVFVYSNIYPTGGADGVALTCGRRIVPGVPAIIFS
jgi:hypothetical protein